MKGLKFIIGFFVYTSTLLVVLAAGGLWLAAQEFQSAGPLQEPLVFEVERGASLNTIASQLQDKGAIAEPFLFIFGAKVLRAESALKAGEYEIQAGMSPRAILRMLESGKVIQRNVTVPEGLTSYQIVQLLGKVELLSGEIEAVPGEGTLLPETYDYRRAESRQAVLSRMADAMENIQGALPAELPKPLSGWNDVVTLASIVEKETGKPEERRRIAGVFLNRLRAGIPLQTDPTVIYALTKGKHDDKGKGPLGRRLLSKDLAVDSPYNTYKYPGLPPGPIANPGRASIEAVLDPEQNEYIYFVADGTGGHVFAKTLEEHNANVAKWRKIRAGKN